MASASSWHNENGFEYALFPSKTQKPDSLIIYLHGLGSDAELPDAYIRSLQDKIPGADVIALRAPVAIKDSFFPQIQQGYSWVPFGKSVKPQAEAWLSHVFKRLTVAEKVEAFASAALTKRGLTEENLAYIGTSLGGIVALQAGLSGEKPVAAVVSRASTVLPFTKVKSKPKIFLQIGEQDGLFNATRPPPRKGVLKRTFSRASSKLGLRHERSVERLRKQKVPLTEKIYPGQGHTLDLTAWNDGVEFIAKALPKPRP